MLERIPPALKKQRRWVCFNSAKAPIDPATGQNARPNDPTTWADFDTAFAAVSRFALAGVGLMLGSGLCGIDIDHCIDPATGTLSELAADIVQRMDTYTEKSPSGTGLHLLWYGTKRGPVCRRASIGLEMYDGARYFTMTGNMVRDAPIQERTEAAAAVYAKYLAKETAGAAVPAAPQAVDQSDGELLELARKAKDGERFAALYAGQWQAYYASHSEADLSFANLLAFWFGCDLERMDRVFRTSGLYRQKWDERHGAKTYGRSTLERAVADCQQIYQPRTPQQDGPAFADEEAALEELHAKYSAGSQAAPAPGKKEYSLDDTGNARRFRDLNEQRLRYNPTDKVWYVWDGKRWNKDEIAKVKRFADEMLDNMERACFGVRDEEAATALRKHVKRSRGSQRKEAFIKEAQHLEGVPMLPAQFDRNKGLFNVDNGILDLVHGKLLPHSRERYITRLAPVVYDPKATAPVWQSFLGSITGNDAALIEYIQVMVGYFLSGSIREQCMFFLFGDGSNGKSTLIEVLQKLFGDYCMTAQAETITSTKTRSSGAARSDVARLKGARLVTIEEGDEGAMLDEGLVKQMTGGNTITARFQYGREFEFRPEFKLLMATNHKPRIRGTDYGIWRRVRIIPLTQHIAPDKQDMLLGKKLEAELPGILNWALEGLAKWMRNSNGGRRHGLPYCEAVEDAVAEYRLEQDRVAAFLAECVDKAAGETVPADALFRAYQGWCSVNNERYSLTGTRFGMEAKKRLQWHKGRCCNEYEDIRLNEDGLRYYDMEFYKKARSLTSEPIYEQQKM